MDFDVDVMAVSLPRVQDEMLHRYKLSRIKFVSFLSDKIEMLKDLSFFLAIVINILLVLAYGVVKPTEDYIQQDPYSSFVVNPGYARVTNGGGVPSSRKVAPSS